ncbi:MAG: RHS repeat protein [Deltaproteobacteria bacterium]|nr:MAG: RHS repeat protein [Deltaproteobacteria bacterium]
MKFFKYFLFTLVLPLSLEAGVNLKNGNFYITYFDVLVPGGGKNLEISRTYNSKSTSKGWFGFGWGSDFETKLEVAADSSVIIHENGSGAETRFVPKGPVNAAEAASKIIAAMRSKNKVSDEVAKNLSEKLINDAELRQAYAKKFDVKADIAQGTKLFSSSRGLQTVTRLNRGFKRRYNDGKYELFDDDGNLTSIHDRHGYKLFLNYKNGKLKSIKDSMGKQLFFELYADGKVKKITTTGGKSSTYKYDGGDLVESKDIADNLYKFTYDSNHNMTSVIYSDGAKMEITYTKRTQFVSQIINRSGEETKYKYENNSKNPNFHYWTLVTKQSGGREVTNRYEYEIKPRPDGSQYTYRTLTNINGFKTETVYSECCSNPVKIDRNGDITTFAYDESGLLTRKTNSSGKFLKLEYDKKIKKINKVTNNDGWTKFEYDKKGNLAKARNSEGKSVLLIYDLKGRISKMIDYHKKKDKKRALTFKYNAAGKPVEIAMSNIGKIRVSYDSYGEIKEVKSSAGSKMAVQVTNAFKNLLSIVRPAGVNLNM